MYTETARPGKRLAAKVADVTRTIGSVDDGPMFTRTLRAIFAVDTNRSALSSRTPIASPHFDEIGRGNSAVGMPFAGYTLMGWY
jgi:hypothetical protein